MAGYVGGGSRSGGGSLVYDTLTSQIDGITSEFTTSESYVSGSLAIFWNGIRQIVSGDGSTVNETSATGFEFTAAVPTTAHTLTVTYEKA